MAKEEWGTKRVCPTTGKRFYDLNRTPIVSPYTGEVVTLETGRSRTMIAERVKPGVDLDDEPVVRHGQVFNADMGFFGVHVKISRRCR